MNPKSGPWPGRRSPAAGCLALLLAGLAASAAVHAQLGTPGASPAASAPRAADPLRPVPSLTGPSDAQRSLDLDNEKAGGKVVPQLRIPLGKNAGPPVFERPKRAAAAASSPVTPIDDSAARCESNTNKQARAACQSRISKP